MERTFGSTLHLISSQLSNLPQTVHLVTVLPFQVRLLGVVEDGVDGYGRHGRQCQHPTTDGGPQRELVAVVGDGHRVDGRHDDDGLPGTPLLTAIPWAKAYRQEYGTNILPRPYEVGVWSMAQHRLNVQTKFFRS